MIYLVIENFKNRNAKEIYKCLREKGRMIPVGLKYISSWIQTDYEKCFQLMECDDIALFREWMSHWSDLMDFEFHSVITSKEMIEIMKDL